jgi:hypothetical protein
MMKEQRQILRRLLRRHLWNRRRQLVVLDQDILQDHLLRHLLRLRHQNMILLLNYYF